MNNKEQLDRSAVVALILSALKDAVAMSDKTQSAAFSEETALIGPAGVLDSLGLVTFALDLEQRISNSYGTWVVLADEREMTRRGSPFSTVGALATHIVERLQNTPN